MATMRRQGTLRVSELRDILRILMAAHGDVPVYIDDPSTGWLLGMSLRYCDAAEATVHNESVETPECIVLETEYP